MNQPLTRQDGAVLALVLLLIVTSNALVLVLVTG